MSSTEAGASITILHQDAHLIAVHKPAGLPVQPDTTGDPDLLGLLAKQPGRQPGLVHRLDRPVSGVVLFALNDDALAALNTLFRERQVRKHYWAIVEGAMGGKDPIVLEHHLKHDAKAMRSRVIKEPSGNGEPARLRVRSLAAGERYTLLEVEPEGGAFHQIRAQLAAAGHPIKGDVKYGARRGEKDRSIALHARSVCFIHPVTQKELCIEAPPPSSGLWPVLLAVAGLGLQP